MHRQLRFRRRPPLISATFAALLIATGLAAPAAVAVPAAPLAVSKPPTPTVEGATEQAMVEAKRTGRPVPVEAATTATDTLRANPDGTLTLKRLMLPGRRKVDGQWHDLDATLRRNADGTLSPTTAMGDLRYCGGGNSPMARMSGGGTSLAFKAPMALPAPTLAGNTATYASVLPGVDLVLTAGEQGGFSHVLVVKDAKAASNPALRTMSFGVDADGVTVEADAAGNLAAKARTGQAVFTAPVPVAWDSREPAAGSARAGTTGAGKGPARVSSHAGPGIDAKLSALGVKVDTDAVTLSASAGFLDAKETVYPVYIDPTWYWSGVGSDKKGYASMPASFPSSNKWNNSGDPDGNVIQVGNADGWKSRAAVNFSIDLGRLTNATIKTAAMSAVNVDSYQCNDGSKKMDVFAPATTLKSSNATWNYWNGVSLGGAVATAGFGRGYNSSCPAAGIGFDVLTGVKAAVSGGRGLQTFFLKSANESDSQNYKEFSARTFTLEITYNRKPNKPGNLTTSPTTSCTAATPTVVGDNDVSLYAPVSDPDGMQVGARFEFWKTTEPTTVITRTDPNVLTVASGSTAVLRIPVTTLRQKAAGAVTQFSWRVQAWDGIVDSDWSATCNFRFDPTRPGRPTVDLETTAVIGQPVAFTITKPPSGTTPTRYLYQLNGGVPGTVDADAATGNAKLTLTPNRFTNRLTVTSTSAAGNMGDTESLTFNAAPPATPAVADDLTGDDVPDLVAVGGVNGLPSGVWLGAGRNNGAVVETVRNIGLYGTGAGTVTTPSDFDGKQVFSGHFTGGSLQDLFVYDSDNGTAVVLNGNGDGSALTPYSGNQHNVSKEFLQDENQNSPQQLANAGNVSQQALGYPDLIGVSGDATGGYHVTMYPAADGTGFFFPVALPNLRTPTGGQDWDTWTIATAQLPTGTAMYLWQRSTGQLHLWTDLVFDVAVGDLTYTAHLLSTSWNAGSSAGFYSSDADQDGDADLWTVNAGKSRSYLLTGLTGTGGTLTAQPELTLSTSSHNWLLNDGVDGLATPAKDISGTVDLTGTGSPTWTTGDLFSPAVAFKGTAGELKSTGPAVTTNADFTLSAWVKPATGGGTVLSQDGTTGIGFRLWVDPSAKNWNFALSRTDAASPVWDIAKSDNNSVQFDVWHNVTATYRQSTGLITLYVDDVNVGYVAHPQTYNAGGVFRVGAQKGGGYFSGLVADVRTWNSVADPARAATPPGYYKPLPMTRILDTRNGLGGVTGDVAANTSFAFQVAGLNGVPTTNVSAVALTIEVIAPDVLGNLTVYPDLTIKPTTSNINYSSTGNSGSYANYVIVPVGSNGKIRIFNGNGAGVRILGELGGYFTTDETTTGITTYNPIAPKRLLDTRYGTGAAAGLRSGGSLTMLQLGGVNGIPAGVKAVAMNVTTTQVSLATYLTTYADGTAKPAVSTQHAVAGRTTSTFQIVPVGANGKIAIFLQTGSTHLLGDVFGYFADGTAGMKYHPIASARMVDTRTGPTRVAPGATLKVSQGNTVIAHNPVLVTNVVSTRQNVGGYVTVYGPEPRPTDVSTLNYGAGFSISNLTFGQTSGATTSMYNYAATIDMVVDCVGYFSSN